MDGCQGGRGISTTDEILAGGTHEELSPALPLRITTSAFALLGGLALSVEGQGIILHSIGT
jgi:hypothetical protein